MSNAPEFLPILLDLQLTLDRHEIMIAANTIAINTADSSISTHKILQHNNNEQITIVIAFIMALIAIVLSSIAISMVRYHHFTEHQKTTIESHRDITVQKIAASTADADQNLARRAILFASSAMASDRWLARSIIAERCITAVAMPSSCFWITSVDCSAILSGDVPSAIPVRIASMSCDNAFWCSASASRTLAVSFCNSSAESWNRLFVASWSNEIDGSNALYWASFAKSRHLKNLVNVSSGILAILNLSHLGVRVAFVRFHYSTPFGRGVFNPNERRE